MRGRGIVKSTKNRRKFHTNRYHYATLLRVWPQEAQGKRVMAPLGWEVVKGGGEGKGSRQGSLANGNGNVNGNRKRQLGSPIRLAAVATCLA